MRNRLIFCMLFAFAGPVGCLPFNYGNANALRMEPAVYPLDDLNTPYDEFNVNAPPPPLYMDALLVFASNAQSRGGRFVIDAGSLTVLQQPFQESGNRRPPLPGIQSSRTGRFSKIPDLGGNTRGPTALVNTARPRRTNDRSVPRGARVGGTMTDADDADRRQRHDPPHPGMSYYLPPAAQTDDWAMAMDVAREPLAVRNDERTANVTWMFDSDHEGKRNLYFVDSRGQVKPFFGNRPDADDAYATYDFKRHVLYFCSNRSGRFEIYRYRNVPGSTDFPRWLGDSSRAGGIERAEIFSMNGDVMAPSIEGDTMLLAAKLAGQPGGFDIYISRFRNGAWQRPGNLQNLAPRGVAINTPHNEFRPVLLNLTLVDEGIGSLFHDWKVLVFSSDRPGGKGGYDLYLTALP